MGISGLFVNIWVILVLRLVLGAVFITSGISKYPDRQRFVLLVVAFDVLPRKLAQLYGQWLPRIEVFIGVLLVLGMATVLAATGSAILIMSFTFAIVLNLLRHRTNLKCGCFGTQRTHRIGIKPVVRNTFLLLLSGTVLLGAPGSLSLDQAATTLHFGASMATPLRGLAIASACVGAILAALPLMARTYRMIRA